MAMIIGRVGAWLELRGRSGYDYVCGGLGGEGGELSGDWGYGTGLERLRHARPGGFRGMEIHSLVFECRCTSIRIQFLFLSPLM